jgi:DNA-binding transcriptional LysR family regulator
MTLTQLLYFLETAREEHVGRAAEKLCISPSAISHSIAALEYEFGQILFTKRGKNIQLSNFGKIMAERADYLLETVHRVKTELLSGTVELQGHYTLGASHILCQHFLIQEWMTIQMVYPHLTGEVYSMRSADVVREISAGSLDFGVCFSPQTNSTFDEHTLYKGQLALIVRRGHPIMDLDPRDRVSRLSLYPAILPKSFQGITNCESHTIFKSLNLSFQEKLLFDDYSVGLRAVEFSDAWSLVPDILLPLFGQIFNSVTEDSLNALVKVSAIWPKKRIQTHVLSHLIELLEKKLISLSQDRDTNQGKPILEPI